MDGLRTTVLGDVLLPGQSQVVDAVNVGPVEIGGNLFTRDVFEGSRDMRVDRREVNVAFICR